MTDYLPNPIRDNFNRADGAVGSAWTTQLRALAISSNQCKNNASGGWSGGYWNGARYGPDCEV